ncbi:hypothetical protein AAFC00_005991 [Neodothiora populina]|uniref:ER membrane protein complex subunit 10 n=1 Tax=Neodothiora populina TaxID=2781224 RepID=A0ABR3P6L1_9PEZI
MRPSTLFSALLLAIPATLARSAPNSKTPQQEQQQQQQQQRPPPAALPQTSHKLTVYTQQASTKAKLLEVSYLFPSLNTTIESYTPYSQTSNAVTTTTADIVKLGFYGPPSSADKKQSLWHGIATSPESLSFSSSSSATSSQKKPAEDARRTIKIYLDDRGEPWHIGFSAATATDSTSTTATTSDGLKIQLVSLNKGPQPILNKPIVVSKDGKKGTGKGDDEEEEKTFLQKYWWAIALFLVIQLAMGGGGDK